MRSKVLVDWLEKELGKITSGDDSLLTSICSGTGSTGLTVSIGAGFFAFETPLEGG